MVDAPIAVPVRTMLARVILFIERLWIREPTIWIEAGTTWTVFVWSWSMLGFGIETFPPPIASNFGDNQMYVVLAVIGAFLSAVQLTSMISLNAEARGRTSFVSAIWLGWLSCALLSADYRIPGGFVYLGFAFAALLPFWRLCSGRRI